MECSATVISQDLYLYVLSVWVDKCKKWRSFPYLRCELLGCTGSCKSCVKCSSCCNESDCDAICNAPEKEYVQDIWNFLRPILSSGLGFSAQLEQSNREKLDFEKKQVNEFLKESPNANNDNTMCCHCPKTSRMLFLGNDPPYFELFRKFPSKVYEEKFCEHSSLIQTHPPAKEPIIYLVEYCWTAFFIAEDSSFVRKCLREALEQMTNNVKNEGTLFINALIGNPDKNYGVDNSSTYKALYELTCKIFAFNPELAQKELQQVEDSLRAYWEYYWIQQSNTADSENRCDYTT